MANHEIGHGIQKILEMMDRQADRQILNMAFKRKGDAKTAVTEKIAEAFKKYVAGKEQPKGLARRVFDRIIDFMGKLRNYLSGRGFKSVNDIFGEVYSGELAKTHMAHEEQIKAELERIRGKYGHESDDQILKRLKDNAAPFRELKLTPETWKSEFGEDQTVKTPVGDVTLGRNQYLKLKAKSREKYFGLIKPTLTDPLYVVEVRDPKEGAERDTKRIYIKPFVGEDKNTYFTSITIQQDGKEISISSHPKEPGYLIKSIKKGRMLYDASARGIYTAAPMLHEHPTNAGRHLDESTSIVSQGEEPVKPTGKSEAQFSIEKKGHNIEIDDKEVESHLQEARGIKAMPMLGRIKKTLTQVGHEFTRHFPLLSSKHDGAVIDVLRQYENVPSYARTKAVDEMKGFVQGLSKEEYAAFERKLIFDDQILKRLKDNAAPFREL
ncbi:MAG: hypothetical protein HQL01_09370, partial [Nitrospirae bacterium]|nr:hypothetical protein [Nitrospirota bacterium]